MNKTLFILLAAEGQPQGGGGSFIWLLLLLAIMWLLMLRPQQKQAKKEQEFRNGLKKGDRVSLSGGIYGKVHEVAEHTVEVEISNGVVITAEKNMVLPAAEPAQK